MRRFLSGVTAAAAVAAAAAWALPPAPAQAQSNETIKVGVIVPLTGRNAVQGEDILRGIQLAVRRVNEGYDIPLKDGERVTIGPEEMGGKIELIIEDNESRPASAVDAARKLVNVDEVPVILGILSSGVCVATGEFTNKNSTVQICSSSTSPELRDIGPFLFSAMGLDTLMGASLADFAYQDSGADRFAVLSANNPFGVGMEIQACQRLEEEYGAECVTTVRYEQGKSDYRADLRRVISEDPPHALITAYGTDARLIFRQAYELGIEPSLWYADYPSLWTNEVQDTPEIIEGIKGLEVGASGDFFREEYADPYEAEFGERPTTSFGGFAYDSAMLVALALHEAGSAEADAIREALHTVSQNYEGATGDKAFDEDGMQVSESYLEQIMKDGVPTPYSIGE